MTFQELIKWDNQLLFFFLVMLASLGWRAGSWLWDKMDDTIRGCVLCMFLILLIYVVQRG